MQPQLKWLFHNFLQPIIVLGGILAYITLLIFDQKELSLIIVLLTIALGSIPLIKETISSLKKEQYALDYIAILAILVSLFTQEYLVGAVIALMISSGRTLEEYGISQARRSLTALIDRIPDEIILFSEGKPGKKEKISAVKKGQQILVRKGEVVPLDGILISKDTILDESSLTGEPYMSEKHAGDIIRSGTVNQGDLIIITVTNEEKDSTYKKIIAMVKEAEGEKPPLVRLADKYSTIFTIVTLIIAAAAFFLGNGSIQRVLAVLVVATPCPLILATPIALMGGINKAAKKRIIIKQFAALETLQRVTTLVFDKTGTITLGHPQLTDITIHKNSLSQNEVLSIAAAIERNSLHPLAKAVVEKAKLEKAPTVIAENVTEQIGMGIFATVNKKTYILKKIEEIHTGMAIGLYEGNAHLATLSFEDELKQDSQIILKNLQNKGYDLHLFTGDKKDAAEKIISLLKTTFNVHADMSPKDKQEGIERLKSQKKVVAMIGDGINDAPALALADVGIVFSNEEQTAASEAADIVLLGGDFALVELSLKIAKQTVEIAMQSILWGIGLSIVAMILASLGLIPPLLGAGIQEAIDVTVILNALRTSR